MHFKVWDDGSNVVVVATVVVSPVPPVSLPVPSPVYLNMMDLMLLQSSYLFLGTDIFLYISKNSYHILQNTSWDRIL